MAANKISCYHCGDPCPDLSFKSQEHVFCCNGCKTVFEVLKAHDMGAYYQMEETPGVKKEDRLFSNFAYLDIDEIKDQLVTFKDDSRSRISFKVPSIHCASCIWLLENLNKIHPGVERVEVDFLKKQADILFRHDEITLRELVELLDKIGYVPDISLTEKEEVRARRKRDLSYIYKLGISGFAFGNIMLLSFPEYFEEGMYLDESFGPFFGYINLILGIPVFFYCSNQYFISAWKGLRHKILNIDVPIALGILVLFVRSSYEILTQTGPGYIDSMTGLVFFLLIGRWFQNRTYQALSFEKDYKSYFPLGVNMWVDGKSEHVLLKNIHKGDQLLIRNGDLIPADAVLIDGEARIDYSFVTGESDPVKVEKGQALFAGGRQQGSQLIIETEKEFSQSYLMQLWKQDKKFGSGSRDMTSVIDKVAQYFTMIVLSIAILTGLYWYFNDSGKMMHAISSVLIIACPCALALCIPFIYGNSLKLLEKSGIYLKDANFIERMAGVDTIVFDKTGTITSQNAADILFHGELNSSQKEWVKSLCNQSNHPLSRAATTFLKEERIHPVKDFKEHLGQGLEGQVESHQVQLGSASFVGTPDQTKASVVHVKIDGSHCGYFQFSNIYRPGLNTLTRNLSSNYEVEMMTGDSDAEKENLKNIFGPQSKLQFNMSPMDKKQHIEQLETSGKRAMMIGDGLNDAGAIERSSVGVSIADDIFGFMPACDAILESEKFEQLHNVLNYSKASLKLVKINFGISFSYNLVGMYFAVQGLLSPVLAAILMPLSSLTVVAFAIFSTELMAKKHKIL